MPTTAYAVTITPPVAGGFYVPVEVRFEHAAAPAAEPNPNPAYLVRDGSTPLQGRTLISDVTTFYFVATTAVLLSTWAGGDDQSKQSVTPAAYATPTAVALGPTSSGTPSADLSSRFAAKKTQVVKSASGTTAVNDHVLASTGGGAISLSLPTGAVLDDEVHIKNIGSNPVTVTAGALTIDNASSYMMNGKHEDQTFRFDGVNWRTAGSQLPLVFVQDQLATQWAAAGGSDDFCLTIANQITTGAAADGVHDLVLLARNNPGIGDADIYVTRDNVNTTGVFYVHMPIKSAHGLQILDSNSVALFDMHATSGAINVGGIVVGGNGANKHLLLRSGGATAEVRVQKSDGTARLTYSEATDTFTFGYAAPINWTMNSGGVAQVLADSSNRLNITGGTGGIRILNQAFSAVSMTITDAGNVVLGRTAPATTATAGFPYLPVMAGTPTGVPTAQAGFVPMVVDSTGNKLWVYVNSAWKGVAVA